MGKKKILYNGNSVITLEHNEEYTYPVVVKKASTSQYFEKYAKALKKEFQNIQILKDIQGIRKCFELITLKNQPVLILEYIEGETLQEYISRNSSDLRSKLKIAIDLARILAEIHQQNLIHLDLNSKNILIGDKQQAVYLIDMGSATHIDRSGQKRVQPDQLFGTLPYIAPEQTGRINRAVDERSDLYSMGVIIYELMTGQLPFDSQDPLKLVHDHIARIPVSPSEVFSGIPEVISAIILKLLSKNAEDRYQSAAGIQADLEKCLQGLSPDDAIEAFQLGEADHSKRLIFPQKLYGRESEFKELVSAFDSASRETSSIMFVSGYSGIGKTVLVEEIQRPVSEKQGYFIRGKFDQYLRTTPYTAITQAFAEFVCQILTEPEKNFNEWRDKVQAAVGELGKVLMEVIPALEEIIGAQPDLPELGGHEAENRFNYVFINFLLTIATKEHPLVLFIDDLQWIDAASLRLLTAIRSEFSQSGLLVIGAYRDNEVDASHPLMEILDNQEQTGLPIRKLKLYDLQQQHLEALLSDTLKSHQATNMLGEMIYEKTKGNPLFSRRLLSSLNEEGLIRYDSEKNSWHWNIGDIKTAAIADNVADLLVQSIVQLPEETKSVLNLAACIGNRFDIPTLVMISGHAERDIIKLLNTSSNGQYIIESGDTYEFVHDQVQRAAYNLIDEKGKAGKHLQIGQLLLADTDEAELEERIFDIVNHYHEGVELLSDRKEKNQLAKLNLLAGRKAKLSSAFLTAAEYFRRSVALLGDTKWDDQYELTLQVYNELIEACYLTIQYKEVSELFDTIHNHVKNTVDSRVAIKTMIMSNIAQNKLHEAISVAEVFLESLNVSYDNALDANLNIDELRELPPIENEEKMAVLEILLAVDTPFIYAKPERLPHLIYTMLNIISKYGNSYVSGAAYTWYAYLLCFGKQYHEGNIFGRLGVDLLNKYPYPGASSKIMDFQYAYLLHWEIPVHDLIAPLKDYYHIGMEEGNFEWGLYCLINHTLLLWGTGKPLNTYLSEIEPSIVICDSKNHEITLLMFLMYAESACNLTGESANKTRLEGKWFSEEKMTSKLEGNDMLLVLFQLIKVTHNYLFGKVGEAYLCVDKLLQYRASLNPHYLYTKISFYGGLSTIGSLAKSENDEDRQDRLKKFEQFEEDLKLWAEVAPMNYQHQYDLVMAEKSRVNDEKWNAVQLYEASIKGAKENRFIHEEALANELFGRFWMQHGNETIAETYIQKAHQLYQQWGANAKVDHLEQNYPQYFNTPSTSKAQEIVVDTNGEDKVVARLITPIQLDLDQITTATQTISSETDLKILLEKMMRLVLSNSGAEKVIFLQKKDDDWYVEAMGNAGSEKYDILLHEPFELNEDNQELIPESIFNYCCRTRENLVVGNALMDDRFVKDKAVQAKNIKSLACIPVIRQGIAKTLIYLENTTVYDVFSPKRMELLKHLATQFGISVENALLYENLNRKVSELKESEMRFRSVIENANETITVTQDELIKYCNPQITELSGYSTAEIRSMNFSEFIHPDDLDIVMKEYQARLSGEQPKNSYSIRILTKDGEEKFALINSTFVDWDGAPASLAMITDITQLKNTELEVIKSKERYELAVSGASAGIWDWDIVSNELYTSDRFKELLGYKSEELVFNMDKFWNLLHADDSQDVQKALDQHLKKGVPYLVDCRLQTKSGEYRWFHARGQALWDKTGKATRISGSITDITERKKAESDLLISDERYELAVRGSSVGIWDYNIVTGEVYYSDRFNELFGYDPQEMHDFPPEVAWDRLHPDHRESTIFALQQHLEKRTPYYLTDYLAQTKSGEYRWYQARGKAVWDESGNATRVAGSLVDIHEQKEAEKKILRSENRFRQLMEQSPLAMEILSPDGKIVMINTAWKKIWKVSDEEAAETIEKYNMLTDPQLEKLGVMEEVKKAFKGKHIILPPVKYDTSQAKDDFDIKQLKNFRSPWVQCHLNTVKDANGAIDYVVNTYVDITDLKETEEILGKSEERYRHLVEHSPLSIAIFTPDGKLNQVNTAWKKLWGLNEEETRQVMENYNMFTDKQIEDFGHAPLVVRAFKGEDIIMPPMEYEGATTTKEMALEDIKSQSCWIQSHLYSVQHANGDLDYVVNINMDLTALKQAEKETERQRDVLARIDRTSSMGQLTGSIAHELNQPLTGILGNAQAGEMVLRNDASNTTELLAIMGDIVSDTKRAGDVIRNLRELYREQKSEFKPIDINSIIGETLILLHSEFVKYDVKVKNILPANMPEVNGNKVQIQQVLVNLLMNAIEAMNGIDTKNYELTISTECDSKEVKVYVNDQGPGIDDDKIAHIFQPLATWKSGGTGMGLAISNSIVESHGGKMHAENLPNGGARVGFKLPVFQEK